MSASRTEHRPGEGEDDTLNYIIGGIIIAAVIAVAWLLFRYEKDHLEKRQWWLRTYRVFLGAWELEGAKGGRFWQALVVVVLVAAVAGFLVTLTLSLVT
ncbi:MAG TPA: hypothetical protein VKD47_01265 [Miltoncostaeaceae bacterium]|nr:hypothetical protein [Miltoncostaeaceae bacterium]